MRTRFALILAGTTALTVLLPGRAVGSDGSGAPAVDDAFTVVGHSVQPVRGGYTTTFEVRNDSQEPATFSAAIQLLDASTSVVGTAQGVLDQPDVLPGSTGFVHVTSAGAEVRNARLVITDSHPVSVPSYRDLSVSPPQVTRPDAGDTDYTVTVTNVGRRPAAGVVVQAVTRAASGEVRDVVTSAAADASALAPGGQRIVTLRREGGGSAPGGTPMFGALGTETLSVPATGSYDPDTVGGILSTTWHLARPRRCPARIVRFTATSPPRTVAEGWTSATGTVRLRFRLEAGFLYSLLIGPSATCGPYRFNDIALKGAITVSAQAPRTARRGRPFTVRGTARGARTGDLVTVQRKSGGPWVTVGSTRVTRGGRFSTRVSLAAPGLQTLRVVVAHTSFHLGAASTYCPVVVAA